MQRGKIQVKSLRVVKVEEAVKHEYFLKNVLPFSSIQFSTCTKILNDFPLHRMRISNLYDCSRKKKKETMIVLDILDSWRWFSLDQIHFLGQESYGKGKIKASRVRVSKVAGSKVPFELASSNGDLLHLFCGASAPNIFLIDSFAESLSLVGNHVARCTPPERLLLLIFNFLTKRLPALPFAHKRNCQTLLNTVFPICAQRKIFLFKRLPGYSYSIELIFEISTSNRLKYLYYTLKIFLESGEWNLSSIDQSTGSSIVLTIEIHDFSFICLQFFAFEHTDDIPIKRWF